VGHSKVDTQFLFLGRGYDERKQSSGDILGKKLRKIGKMVRMSRRFVN